MSQIKILLVEDEVALGQIVKDSLQYRNFDVRHCFDGQSALIAYHEYQPDLLVLDVMLPKLDGFSLAKTIRSTDKKTPIIFLTAKSMTEDVVEGFNIGGNDFLKKPFSMEELIVRINSLLNRTSHIDESKAPEEVISIGDYNFNYKRQILSHSNNQKQLTHR